MPITDTLKTAEELRQAGFPENQANLPAAKFEETAHAQSEDLKSFFRSELGNLENRLEAKFDAKIEWLRVDLKQEIQQVRADLKQEIGGVRVEMHSLARDQLLKIVTVMALMISVAVAIIKLFPNLS